VYEYEYREKGVDTPPPVADVDIEVAELDVFGTDEGEYVPKRVEENPVGPATLELLEGGRE
jgi:hypothetical protein